jgi:hypothetical protein
VMLSPATLSSSHPDRQGVSSYTGADGQQYKIVGPLSENNRFNSPAEFLKMIGKD